MNSVVTVIVKFAKPDSTFILLICNISWLLVVFIRIIYYFFNLFSCFFSVMFSDHFLSFITSLFVPPSFPPTFAKVLAHWGHMVVFVKCRIHGFIYHINVLVLCQM